MKEESHDYGEAFRSKYCMLLTGHALGRAVRAGRAGRAVELG